MIQDQLVEYISAQMKAGVPRETIKSTLIGAGWQAADVEDTLQKVGGAGAAQPMGASPAAAKPASTGPQTIKMSDLISTSDPATTSSVTSTTTTSSTSGNGSSSGSKSFTGSSRPVETKTTTTSFTSNEYPPKTSRGSSMTKIVLIALVVIFAAIAGYLYFSNNSLNSKITALNGTSSGAASQLTALQQSFTASTTAWDAEASALNGKNAELQAELSFYVAPPGAAADATSSATIAGTVSGGGKSPYLITATYGAQIYISNSKDTNVAAALAPIEASSTTAQFTGTYLPGADSMTLTAVNGTTLQ